MTNEKLIEKLHALTNRLYANKKISMGERDILWDAETLLLQLNKGATAKKKVAKKVTIKKVVTKSAKVFKTADGVVIEPGMRIYVKPPKDGGFRAHCEKVGSISDKGPVSAYLGTIFRDGLIIPEIVYSSSDAASKAAGMPTVAEHIKKAQKAAIKKFKKRE